MNARQHSAVLTWDAFMSMCRRADTAVQMPHFRCCRNSPERKAEWAALGNDPSPDAFNALLAKDIRRTCEAVRAAQQKRHVQPAAKGSGTSAQVRMPPPTPVLALVSASQGLLHATQDDADNAVGAFRAGDPVTGSSGSKLHCRACGYAKAIFGYNACNARSYHLLSAHLLLAEL